MTARYPMIPGGLCRDIPTIAAEAKRLTSEALSTGSAELARRALNLRAEVEVQMRVGAWQEPDVPGDAGPYGPGRGALEAGEVAVMTYSAKRNDWVPTVDVVARRSLSRTLRGMGAEEQRAAFEYEALVAERGSMRCLDLEGVSGGPGGVSDGGAAARWDGDARLSLVEEAIGRETALKVRRQTRSPNGQPRRSITVRVLTDAVCLYGRALEDVLGRHGWSRDQNNRNACKAALTASLQRVAAVL